MKASKDALRTARQLLRLSFSDGKIDAERVRGFIKRIVDEKPRGYVGVLSAFH